VATVLFLQHCTDSTEISGLVHYLRGGVRWMRLKGTVSRDGYILEGLNILISTFCICADGFQGLSKAFRYPIKILTFYLLL
jgi:hypothetical protein